MEFEPVDITEVRNRCRSCGRQTSIMMDVCSHCGARTVSHRAIRMAGFFYLIIGLAIDGVLLYIGWWIAVVVSQSGKPGATVRFSGKPSDLVWIYAILATVSLIGLTAIVTGVWQIMKGTRNRKLVRVAMFWYGAMWAAYFALALLDIVEPYMP